MATLHPFTAVRDAVGYGVQFGSFGFFLGVVGSSLDLPLSLVFVLAPAFAAVGIGYGLARYAVFEYELGESALHITSGVVQRQQREIPLGRVQNVDVEQSLLQRALGLAVVRFETAGGGATEATLRMVGKAEADRLQSELRRRKREARAEEPAESAGPDAGAAPAEGTPTGAEPGTGPATPPAASADAAADATRPAAGSEREVERPPETDQWGETGEEEVLFELSVRELLVLSGVTFRWGVVPLSLFALPMVGDVVARFVERVLRELLGGGTPDPAVLALAATAGVALLLVSWLVSAAITFVRYYDFRLSRVGDELVYERGLLQRYSGSIPMDKVQTLTVTENALMRQFGYAALTVETAGYAPGGRSGSNQGVPSAVPLAERAAVREFVETFEGVGDLSVEGPPRRARRRYAGRYALVTLGATALAYAVHTLVRPLGVLWTLPLVGLLAAPPAAHLKWRHLGHRTDDDHFLAREGFWHRTTRVVPHYRIQTVATERTVFQRRWNLGSVVADTASSGSLLSRAATAHDVDDGTARELHRDLRERLHESLAEHRGD